MKYKVLFSGSKGNASILQSGKTTLLIDCGMPLSRIEEALTLSGVKPADITAVLITHEHSDHMCGLESFSKKHKKKVWVHKKNFANIAKKLYYGNHHIDFFDGSMELDGISISTYTCSHDSLHCCGYKFSKNGSSIAIVTDLGKVDKSFFEFVKGCDLVALESNYDQTMLQSGTYPLPLKKRVASDKGHLSNTQASEVVSKLPELGVSNVWLLHLSENNNAPELAFSESFQKLRSCGYLLGQDIRLSVIPQKKMSEVFVCEKK